MTVVAHWAKVPGIHYYVAGSIPAVTPRYCMYKENRKMLFGAQKNKGKKYCLLTSLLQICPVLQIWSSFRADLDMTNKNRPDPDPVQDPIWIRLSEMYQIVFSASFIQYFCTEYILLELCTVLKYCCLCCPYKCINFILKVYFFTHKLSKKGF